MTRRTLFFGATAICVASSVMGQAVSLPSDGMLSVSEAHDLVVHNQITLIDVRRPDEWAQTGSGQGAHRIDMRSADFIEQLDELVESDRSRPVAIICARGVRSKWVTQQLVKAGFSNVLDVPEGMVGSAAGPGWVRSGLPVEK